MRNSKNMENCSPLWWFAWLAVFYRKEFDGKTLHGGQVQWKAAPSATVEGTDPSYYYIQLVLSYSHSQSTFAFLLTWTPFFPAAAALPFPPLPPLIPTPPFHCRCQACPELSLPCHPSILHFPSPDCQPRTLLGKERNKKSQPGGFSIYSSLSLIIHLLFLISDNFPQMHLWIMATYSHLSPTSPFPEI